MGEIELTQDMRDIIAAHERGEVVEFRAFGANWRRIQAGHKFNMKKREYRIAPIRTDYINWDHVSIEYKYMARDANGVAELYQSEPIISERAWGVWTTDPMTMDFIPADAFTSYKQGTVSWDKSLVKRP